MKINHDLVKNMIIKSKEQTVVYEDIEIDGRIFKKVPVKKDEYTLETVISGPTIIKYLDN